ncbi:hypothetical protein HKX54_14800 [Sulfitobacter sp. M57]|uniref:hypothetical protein n=1 Tax=unclassified Sulfitobacter TaxID=196795 RepID=UPI0023E1827B|nr:MULTISPECIES: hypothetical protein [unclassified Sulfitobacter]MDF3415740.1 hypothetical protein [Sulfitobacter sp. KE5]MDF3423220.1 hypothetical protein [Sulfitobacter sp. KE43]MDF3434286.1 hypothetical protein [Sulfitobacter sp. KE42]MDF3459681.1 hypothetical protein [Sulfitobacter sp. S74]MDF3463824.1 hypothetical protein [Sulfitobacter sp. Ks18]
MKAILKASGAASAALMVGLAVMGRVWLQPGDFGIFDAHFGGYSVDAARLYLAALKQAGRTELYLGVFRVLDTVLPILLSFTLAGVIWTQARGMPKVVRGVVALTPCVYLWLDLSENAAVAHLLRFGPQVSAGAILQASAYTVAKWICLTLAMLLAVWAWRLAPKEERKT